MDEMRNAYKILVGSSEGNRPLGRPWSRLERILRKYSGKLWAAYIWLRIETSGGFCEHSNEPSGSIKGGKLIH
jgi:hypothetical protein